MDWYKNGGNSASFKTITSAQRKASDPTEWKLLSNINAGSLSAGKPLYFNSKCTGKFRYDFSNSNIRIITVTYVKKDNPAYRGCPGKEGSDRKCNKKLMDEGNGNYRCEKCDFRTTAFKWKLILNAQVIQSQNYFILNS